jgi:hypothetical protein
MYADTNNIYDPEPGNICDEHWGHASYLWHRHVCHRLVAFRDCQVGVYCGRTKLCNKLFFKIKCLYANSDQCKYIKSSAYWIMISQLVSFNSCYFGCSTYKNSYLPVMTEVHEILVILNIYSFTAYVCLGYHVHSYSAPSRMLCVIRA